MDYQSPRDPTTRQSGPTRRRRLKRRRRLRLLGLILLVAIVTGGLLGVVRAKVGAGTAHATTALTRPTTVVEASSTASSATTTTTMASVAPTGSSAVTGAGRTGTTKARTSTQRPTTTTTAKAATTKAATSTRQLATTTTTAASVSFPIPVVVGNASQIITVAASGTSATVQAWQRGSAGTWAKVVGLGPMSANVGRSGVRAVKKEGDGATPAGTFTLTMAFGVGADPGSGLPYRLVDAASYWVSDPASASYNTWQELNVNSNFNPALGEHLASFPTAYRYAVVIDYNRFLVVPGAGSAIFLHVGNGEPTIGCVTLSQTNVIKILRWLNPAKHPRIAIH